MIIASSKRSVSWGEAPKSASENTGERRGAAQLLPPSLSPFFPRSFFRAVPELIERLEEATMMKEKKQKGKKKEILIELFNLRVYVPWHD